MNDTPKMYVKTDAPTPVVPVQNNNPFVAMTMSDLLQTFAVGAIVGLVSTGLFYVMNRFIFGAALCRTGVEGCSSAPMYSAIIAMVVGTIIGIIALAKAGIYRPLPAVIAAHVALWGAYGLIYSTAAWYWGLLIGAIVFGLAYMLFAWLARIRSFIISIIVLVAVAVIVRLVIG